MTSKRVRFKVKIQPSGHSYFPEEVREGGFVGEVEGLPNHATFLLVRPGATDEEILQSLELHAAHIRAGMAKHVEVVIQS